ncbi:hypothetical protein [Nocardia thraciensis]
MPTTIAAISATSTDVDLMIEQRCNVYRDLFELNAFRDPATGAIHMGTGRLWAVIVPKSVGARARTLLREQCVPVYSVDHAMWVFLTDPPAHTPYSVEVGVNLCRFGAAAVLPGRNIELPTPGNEKRCWLQPPIAGGARPPFDTVVDAIVTAGNWARWP